ncbi:MAG: hypothetical protein VKL58_06075 [Cyanobacteriota bacterium]|nr:hypothetical protein [Cyanobacteriota bacterium]
MEPTLAMGRSYGDLQRLVEVTGRQGLRSLGFGRGPLIQPWGL